VPDFSSRLGLPSIEVVEQIANYHSQMCIFQDLADSEYKKVEAAVSRMVRSARSRRTGVRLTRKEKTAILSSLGLGQTDARRETIKREKVGTCEWLITHPEYHKWLNSTKDEPHSDVLWIRGKPGTGKSTMMKFALRRAKEAMPDKIVISFFFNARGDDSEKSAASMYRSLLAQLLRCLPALQTIFEAPVFDAQRHREPQDIRWTAELLKELFAAAINSMGNSSVICFVDALDECNRDEDRDTVSFLEGLCQTYARPETDFRICLSTRLFPNYATAAPVIKLEDQEGHSQDIINFLDAELRIGQGRFAEEIRSRIRSKASGVFMWVVLVVQILNQEHDAGNDAKLEQTIENTPNDLRGLFRGILIPGDTSSIELLLCLLWVLCARRPLTPAELYFAIHAYTQSTILGDWDPQKTTLEVMERFILSSSHGLTETTQSATPTVQFIHESVKDFLVEQGGLREVWPDAGTDRLAESHKILGECCRSCIATSFDTGLRGSVEAANRSQPFLGYAVHHILYHADTAQARQRSYSSEQNQATLVNNFPLHQWRHFHNLFLQDKSREHLSETSLLYILAEHDCPSLITIFPGREHGFRVEVSGERYGSPIVAALVEARHETVRVLLRETLDKLPHECPLYRALRQYQWTERSGDSFPAPWPTTQETLAGYLAQYGDDTLAAFSLLLTEPDVHINDRTALCWAAEKGHLALVEFLVGRGATLDPDLMDPPLLLAARNGHEAVVRFLLDNQAQVDGSNGRKGQRPLAAAVEGNHTEIAQLLIESGADLKGAGGSCPLLTACVHGRLNMLRLILAARKQYKVDPNIETLSRQTPLHLAAGHPEIVKTLLGMGHRANVADEEGLTPLGSAAVQGNEDSVKALLDKGARLEDKNDYGQTPLSLAAIAGHGPIIKLLISRGANRETTDWDGHTPLSHAVRNSNEHAVKALLDKSAEVDSEDKDRRTPLSWAAESGCEDVASRLIRSEANVNSRDKQKKTPLMFAVEYGHEGMARLLLENGADVNSRDTQDRPVLWYAAYKQNDAIVRLLLEKVPHMEVLDGGRRLSLRDAFEEGGCKGLARLLDPTLAPTPAPRTPQQSFHQGFGPSRYFGHGDTPVFSPKSSSLKARERTRFTPYTRDGSPSQETPTRARRMASTPPPFSIPEAAPRRSVSVEMTDASPCSSDTSVMEVRAPSPSLTSVTGDQRALTSTLHVSGQTASPRPPFTTEHVFVSPYMEAQAAILPRAREVPSSPTRPSNEGSQIRVAPYPSKRTQYSSREDPPMSR